MRKNGTVLVEVEIDGDYSAQNLLTLRQRAGFSRREFLELLEQKGVKMHATTLRRIEEGEQDMKVYEALAACAVFDVELQDFVSSPINPVESVARGRMKALVSESEKLVNQMLRLRDLYFGLRAILDLPECPPPAQSKTVRELTGLIGQMEGQMKGIEHYLVELLGEDRVKRWDESTAERREKNFRALGISDVEG